MLPSSWSTWEGPKLKGLPSTLHHKNHESPSQSCRKLLATIGSAIGRDEASASLGKSGQSGVKRPCDVQGASASSAKKGGSRVAPTPERSNAEQRYLRAKVLCFHCMLKAGHRVQDCDQKVNGVAAKPMPADF